MPLLVGDIAELYTTLFSGNFFVYSGAREENSEYGYKLDLTTLTALCGKSFCGVHIYRETIAKRRDGERLFVLTAYFMSGNCI